MQPLRFVLTLFFLSFAFSDQSFDCELDPYNESQTITVDQSGNGNFKTIQSAIDSVPENNNNWIHILISSGTFEEKVTIPLTKPCIFLEGAGRDKTMIEWQDHESTDTSATFTSYPDNIVAKGIAFVNTYNTRESTGILQAVAARIYGDKSAFYNCGFLGVQDTLWDVQGRHYYQGCYIAGAIDFIWGSAQSMYEGCQIILNVQRYASQFPNGIITAQGRNSPEDPSGFVFKKCTFTGVGKTLLGRGYGPYSRVIIYDSNLANIILPAGWDAWAGQKHENQLMYVEAGNTGPGSNTSQRVPWVKKVSVNDATLDRYLASFWIPELPTFS